MKQQSSIRDFVYSSEVKTRDKYTLNNMLNNQYPSQF